MIKFWFEFWNKKNKKILEILLDEKKIKKILYFCQEKKVF